MDLIGRKEEGKHSHPNQSLEEFSGAQAGPQIALDECYILS
jgi:hypothetical protein